MKYTVFFFGLLIVVPFCALLASQYRRAREVFFACMVLSTTFLGTLDINFMYRGWYHAANRGFQVSVIDFLVIVVLAGSIMSARREGGRWYWPTSFGLMLLFIAYASTSVAFHEPKLFGCFELFTLIRGLLAFLAVAFYLRDDRDVRFCLALFCGVLLYEGLLAIAQRYFMGYMRVPGSLEHPSALADYCCTLAPTLLAVGLSRSKFILQVLCLAAWSLACAATILTITRMGIAAFMVASLGVFAVSMTKPMPLSKVIVIVLGVLLALGLFARGYDRVAERHAGMLKLEESGDAAAGRRAYCVEAWNMAKQKPFGIGLNNWSYWVSAQEGNPYAGTDESGDGPRAIMAHSAFALTLGELGWPGLIVFLALWGQWFRIAGRHLLAQTPDFLQSVLTGVFFAILAAFLAALTEHNFRNQLFYIVFNIILGFSVAVRRIYDTRGFTARLGK